MMQEETCILLLLWLPFSLGISNQTLNNSINTLPGCQSKCGNLTVPYPFGIGINAGCSIDPWFDINCDTSFNPPKAFLSKTNNQEVIDISGTKIRLKNYIASKCYNNIGGMTQENSVEVDLGTSPFSFSNENKFTVVGCDYFWLIEGKVLLHNSISSCFASCSYSIQLSDESCSGIGCCQTYIPKGLKRFIISQGTLLNNTKVFSYNPCGYSFLGEQDRYKFRVSDLFNPIFPQRILKTVPLVIDWVIGNQTCVEVQKSSDFACQENSICVDSDTGLEGYRCNCSNGYEGNPYLRPGCQDINECENNPCHEKGICTNTPGGYNCSCRRGYLGDGRTCIAQHSNNLVVYTGLGTSIGLLLLLVVTYWLYKVVKKRKKHKRIQKFFKRNGGLLLQQQISTNEGLVDKTSLFTAKELLKATDQFNESRILGRGGQGTVYKGMLSDGRTIAVKKSKVVSVDQLEQFINEVVILSQINHRNVVKLLGCCLETEVPLLVYEFIANRTLFDHIHDLNAEFPITWYMRLRIAAEIAGALAYLHYETSVPIYHRDIKSSNILLDENYKPKVSDFGISRSIAIDQTHLTTLVKGTFGYLDPEYFQSSQFTEKSDVYSFGVVLVELLSGQKAISSSVTEDERSLATRFLVSMKRNCLHKILDPRILEQDNEKDIVGVANLAYGCLNLNGKERPTMKEVAMELENIRQSKTPASAQRVSRVINTEVGSLVMSDINSTWTISDHNSSLPADTNPLLYQTV
ncbi:Wall-associated receptor kinase-like 9 [Forsythia ovata]|uniref:Wall-associated receptor kinase-like 9 n=1 Tax=Forsythia ovata TaxID=205694 RepID=A0ABD1W5J6_9LAMI